MHGLEAGAAVDGGGLLDAGGNRVEVVAQHVDRDRGHLGDVDDEQAGQGAALADRVKNTNNGIASRIAGKK